MLTLLCNLVHISLVVLGAAAYQSVIFPSQEVLELINGTDAEILHQIWFNESESHLRVYVHFKGIIISDNNHDNDDNVNFRVSFDTSCSDSTCNNLNQFQPSVLKVGQICQRIQINLIGHADVHEEVIEFHLYNTDNYNWDVIEMLLVTVTESVDDITSAMVTTDVTTKSETESIPQTTTSNGLDQGQLGNNSKNGDIVTYAFLVLFLTVILSNLVTVIIAVNLVICCKPSKTNHDGNYHDGNFDATNQIYEFNNSAIKS